MPPVPAFLWLVYRILVFSAGLVLVAWTVSSAIRSFVLPRGAHVWLTWSFSTGMRALFRLLALRARSYEASDAVMALYAPVTLLTLPGLWLVLLLIGFSGMFWAVNQSSGTAAMLLSGSSLFTLGFASLEHERSALLVFAEAGLGLMLLSLLIAYLPTIYSAFSRREAVVTMLEVRAGSPPSAVVMLERYHRLHRMDALEEVWTTWEVWFTELAETHTSLGILPFFRSPQPEHSWVTAAGAVLDAAALFDSTVDLPRSIPSNMCLRAGYIALRQIAAHFRIAFDPDPRPDGPISITREEYDEAWDELARAGLPLRDRAEGWKGFAGWRVNYDLVLLSLAEMIMAPPAPWTSDRGAISPERTPPSTR